MDHSGDCAIIQAVQFEPEIKIELRRHLGLAPRHNSDGLEDLLQEIYARLWTAAQHSTLKIGGLKLLLFDILKQVLNETPQSPAGARSSGVWPAWLARPRVTVALLRSDAKVTVAATPEEKLTDELLRYTRALAKLPNVTRRIFTLRKVYGYSYKQIADRVRLSADEVEKHLVRCAKLCAQLEFDPEPPKRLRRIRWRRSMPSRGG